VAGVTAAYGVMAALLHRARTGEGQRVEVPMFDSALAFNLTEHLAAAAIKGAPAGYTRILTEHRRPHRTSDGYLSVLPYSDQQWLDIFAAVGRSEQLDHPAFADRFSRNQNSGFVYAKLGEAIALRSTSEWMDVCLKHDIPAAAVPELDDLVEDPAKNRGVLVEADHPVIGKYRQIRPPVIFDGSPSSVRRHAPLIGEHTVEILAEIGLDEDEIDQMLESGAATQAWVPQLIGLLVHIPG
jgi:crotonobetainyl-CoA:carnitine CoA-transferase CaiB-like acyl-CoA transferase